MGEAGGLPLRAYVSGNQDGRREGTIHPLLCPALSSLRVKRALKGNETANPVCLLREVCASVM